VAKGTTVRPVRVPDDIWNAAVDAFPAERGKSSGVSAELQSFVTLLAEQPDAWKEVKAVASARGVDPWQLVIEAVREYAS